MSNVCLIVFPEEGGHSGQNGHCGLGGPGGREEIKLTFLSRAFSPVIKAFCETTLSFKRFSLCIQLSVKQTAGNCYQC